MYTVQDRECGVNKCVSVLYSVQEWVLCKYKGFFKCTRWGRGVHINVESLLEHTGWGVWCIQMQRVYLRVYMKEELCTFKCRKCLIHCTGWRSGVHIKNVGSV